MLLQEVVLLLLVQVFTGLVANVSLQILKVYFAVQGLHRAKKTLFHGLNTEKLDFLGDGERHIRADEVESHHVVVDVVDGEDGLVGDFLSHINVVVGHLPKVVHGGLPFLVVLVGHQFRSGFHLSGKVRNLFHDMLQVESSHTLHYDGNHTGGKGQLLENFCIDTIIVQIALNRHFNVGVFLADNTDERARLFCFPYQLHARFAANDDRSHHAGEKYQVSNGKYGNYSGSLYFQQVFKISLNIGNHGECFVILFIVH